MSKKVLHFCTLILAAISLAACTRVASVAPAVPLPETTLRVMEPFQATQTAQAIISQFNQPTRMVANAKGTLIAITMVPPTLAPVHTPTPTGLPATPVVTRPDKYAVRKGETIYCLARRFDVDPEKLLSVNKLDNYSILSVGDELTIPTDTKWPGERKVLAHPDTWNISPGETVFSIACEYGDVFPESIIQVNGLKEPYDLSGLKTLQIP